MEEAQQPPADLSAEVEEFGDRFVRFKEMQHRMEEPFLTCGGPGRAAALRADLGTLSNRYLKAKHRGVSFPVGDGIRWPVAGWELCPRRNFHERMLAQRGHCQVGRRHPGLWTNELP